MTLTVLWLEGINGPVLVVPEKYNLDTLRH